MSKSKNTVRLRKKELANGNQSLYLDIWFNGKRSYEFLKLYMVNAKNSIEREANRRNLELAESVRAKRQIEIKEEEFGFASNVKANLLFLDYFENLTMERYESQGNYGNWESTLKHLRNFCSPTTKLKDINQDFAEGFKNYLSSEAATKSQKRLSINSQHSYFNKFKASINKAINDGIISKNPLGNIRSIKPEDTKREYLTLDELRALVVTECRLPILKNAFLFCCLTGIRFSDANNLIWKDVRDEKEQSRIIFRQKKTKGQEYLDISNQARKYLGERTKEEERVFKGLKYSAWTNVELQKWVMRAGVKKEITFHCSRHTFAVIQLNLGTDIFTVSKLLGHTHLKTTQIYAKIVDEKKKEAMNKFPEINLNE